jgi:hypothetical protein
MAAVRPGAFVARRFDFAMQLLQLRAVAGRSLRTLAKGWTVFAPLIAVALLTCIAVPARMEYLGVPLLPRTEHVLTYLTAALANPANRVWMIVPLLTIFYAGELVWGERDARMGEIGGAAPVPDWVFFVGKFLALACWARRCSGTRTSNGACTRRPSSACNSPTTCCSRYWR